MKVIVLLNSIKQHDLRFGAILDMENFIGPDDVIEWYLELTGWTLKKNEGANGRSCDSPAIDPFMVM